MGRAIDLKPGYETFWCYIPHFIHSPFYVYAYAFGDCLVNSLYAVYEKAEKGFADRYLDMLAAGGTKHHKELLAPFGLDASDPNFWSMGLKVIEGLIDELEAMDEGPSKAKKPKHSEALRSYRNALDRSARTERVSEAILVRRAQGRGKSDVGDDRTVIRAEPRPRVYRDPGEVRRGEDMVGGDEWQDVDAVKRCSGQVKWKLL